MPLAYCPDRPARPLTRLLAAALSVAVVTFSASAAAADKSDTPRTHAATRPSASVKSTATSRSTRPAKAATHRQALKSAASDLALASATAEAISDAQLGIAAQVLTGDADCEFNQRISVLPEPDRPGYFRVSYKNLYDPSATVVETT